MREPTVSVTVAAPGGVLSDSGLTAVAVPTCCAAAGTAVMPATASTTAMRLKGPIILRGFMAHLQNLNVGPAETARSRIENAGIFETSARYCTSIPRLSAFQTGTSKPRPTRHSVLRGVFTGSMVGSGAL